MPLPDSYTILPKSLTEFLKKMRSAGVPPRVTFEFLKTLGFKSSNDRSLITVLKSIGFLDQSGAPTELYKKARDQTNGPKVLAQALRDAYSDLFLANEKANQLSQSELRNIIASKTNKAERVVQAMAATFATLAKSADFSVRPSSDVDGDKSEHPDHEDSNTHIQAPKGEQHPHLRKSEFHYNIQIHLPTTTDITVYNAIFKSLRDNLS
jgi:uncharacterized protein DUF5343